jgi:hypothetical protein
MAGDRRHRRSRRRTLSTAIGAVATAVVLLCAPAVTIADDGPSQLGDLPLNPQWLVNTLSRAVQFDQVKNNTPPEALARRDQAVADWKAAEAAWQAHKAAEPNPLAKPEYNVVWSSKQNVADVYGSELGQLVTQATINPQGLLDLLNPQFLPGLDGFQVIDERKLNLDGSLNPDYGKVVNFVQLPLPWGIENEAHHMQYEWHDGDLIVAGGLYTGTVFVLSPKDIPNLQLTNISDPTQHLGGTIADAFEKGKDGRFTLTLMGGPIANFGGSPGELVTYKPDPRKGLVQESEVPAGNIEGILAGDPNGLKEPCTLRESRPLGTCANPHGIQFRTDLNRGLTADYAEPREIVLDPVKTIDKYAFRPTVRSWDISNPAKPKLIGVAHVPNGPIQPAQRAHEQYGIMEDAKTWPDAKNLYNGLDSKAFFAGSMCGGGIFLVPDITKATGDFSGQIKQVWNDGLSEVLSNQDPTAKFEDEPGGCAGGAWHQVAPNNRILFRAVQGRNPGSDNYFDQGQGKLIYDLDISKTIEAASNGTLLCDLSRGIHTGGYDLTGIQVFQKLAKGEQVADCPHLISDLVVHDPTSGGPHWAALDNHSLDQDGVPYRLTFSDYFVSRTGVDGDHRFYTVNVDKSGVLSYDEDFRDENTGALGVNFNRRDWPGSPDAGFYKPHSMLWVCPPGICPDNAPTTPRGVTVKTAKRTKKKARAHRRVKVSARTKAHARRAKGS